MENVESSPNGTHLSARALFDYEATEENELSFKCNEIIRDIDTSYDTWWYGCNENGEYGLFPSNYVEIFHEEMKEQPAAGMTMPSSYKTVDPILPASTPSSRDKDDSFSYYQGLTGRALYDYEAADETEIGFREGDIIKEIETIDEGWWRGQDPFGNVGLFPANHIELLESLETQ